MSFPYRNTLKRTKDWKIDRNFVYTFNSSNRKPNGLWYAIKDSLYQHDFEDLYYGEYMFELKVDTKCLYVISNFEELKKLQKKYSYVIYFSEYLNQNQYEIDWKKMSKDYCGFEVKNYYKIRKQIKKNYKYPKRQIHNQYDWLDWFDYNSGCIWDLKAVKNVLYVRNTSTN